MSDFKENIRIVNLSNYVQPEVKEYAGREWVTYGKRNQYFQYLIDRSRGSATNGAVCNSIIDLIYGEGLTANDAAMKPNEFAMMKSIFGEEDVKRSINDIKRMGQAAFQIQYNKKGKVLKAIHLPIETLAPEKVNDDGEIEAYYYAADWSKVRGKDQTERIPAFGFGSGKETEILYIKSYNSGLYYFSTVDYHGSLQYADLEEEIGNYHLNNIQNGLAPSMLINFNNGHPGEEKAKMLEKRIQDKYSGSTNAGRFILSFNDNKETEASITPVPLSDAAEQYQFLSDECVRKILVGHRVTSPLLLGISTNTGFGSNADELKTASLLFESLVIKPFRHLMIQHFDDVLAVNDISLKLEFESLNPFDTDKADKVDSLKLSHDHEELNGVAADYLIELGEDEDLENWELIDEMEVDYEQEERLDKLIGLASTGTARPNAKSEQDGVGNSGETYKVRYQYVGNRFPQREFCVKMMGAKKIYRKEDIIQMGNQAVNPGWGLNGADTYSIWLYKGGGNCYHKWNRKTYKSRDGVVQDVNNPNAQTVSTGKARSDGFRPEPNAQQVPVAPINMPKKGFVNKN